jgi:hypothetical protein
MATARCEIVGMGMVCRPAAMTDVGKGKTSMRVEVKTTTADVIRDDDDQLPQWFGRISSLVA